MRNSNSATAGEYLPHIYQLVLDPRWTLLRKFVCKVFVAGPAVKKLQWLRISLAAWV